MSARDTGPGARHGCPGQRDISRVVWRAATLVMWGQCALGAAMGTAWAAPATGTLSCAAVGAPSRVGLASNAGSARITLNSAQGAGGTKLIVHGTGWPANAQITVNEESNGQGIPGDFGVQVVAAADGTFEAPAFGAARATCGFDPSPGLIVQIVARTADKQVSAMAPFTYVASPPALTSPSSGDQVEANATSVAIAGTNWDAGVVVTLWTSTQLASMNTQDPWQPPTGARTTQAQADTQGVITADVPLAPGQRPGTWIVVSGSATSARYGEVVTTLPANFFLQPPVAPALRLDRTQGSAGATVTVTGSQYWPGDTVTIAYCRGAPRPGSQPIVRCNQYLSQLLGQATVDLDGRFTARVTLPSDARIGLITFEAYATTAIGADGDPYTLTTPFHIVAPANAQTGLQTWSTAHPRLARTLTTLAFGTPLLLAIAGAAWWLSGRRRRAAGRVGPTRPRG